jgi:hypothetical protein
MTGVSNDDRLDALDPTPPTTRRTLQDCVAEIAEPVRENADLDRGRLRRAASPEKHRRERFGVTTAAGAVSRHLAQVVGAPGGRTSSSPAYRVGKSLEEEELK